MSATMDASTTSNSSSTVTELPPPAAGKAATSSRQTAYPQNTSHMSFAQRKTHQQPGPSPQAQPASSRRERARDQRPATASSRIIDGDDTLLRDVERPLPGDVTKVRKGMKSPDGLGKQKSSYFEDAFDERGVNPLKDRLRSEAIVMAEVRTNVIVTDEFTFITDLSYHLSNRYHRPVSSIVVTLQHGTCMLFGGTFEPAYIMSVFALPSQLQPTTNKRNSALIQKHMEEALGVKPQRGYLRFVPTPEESVAVGGKTMAGEMDDIERAVLGDDAMSISSRRSKAKKRLSVRSLSAVKANGAAMDPSPPPSAKGLPPIPSIPETPTLSQDRDLVKPPPTPTDTVQKKAKRRKSLIASLFGRNHASVEPMPTIPA